MTSLLAVSGSPSLSSRTALLMGHLVRRLSLGGFDVGHPRVRDLPAEDLLAGRRDSPAMRRALEMVDAADGLIVATPVYKASYTGVLKAFLDVLPQSALAGKTVLPLVTGGSIAHLLAIDYALRPVLCALGARHVVAGCFLLDTAIGRQPDGGVTPAPDAQRRLEQTVDDFVEALPAGRIHTVSR